MTSHARPPRCPIAFLFLNLVLLLTLSGCGDDELVQPPVNGADISGIVMDPDGEPAAGAMAYLGVLPFTIVPAPTIVDSVMTDGSGRFVFDDLSPGTYQVYAGMWNALGNDFSLVSPFSSEVVIRDKGAKAIVNLALELLKREGVVAGSVFYEAATRLVPADSTDISLYRYLGAGAVLEAEGRTNAKGQYALPGVRTGNYSVVANRVFNTDGPFPLFLTAQSEDFFCDGVDLAKVETLVLHDSLVEKPAVYIYPGEPGVYEVLLGMGPGVRLTASDPDYGEGWSVFVDGDGRIDDTWDYLFYEVGLRGAPRIATGWCLAWPELFDGLARITTELGLNAAEREDFLTYWRVRLPPREFYEVHPVLGTDLDPWVTLHVDPAPRTTLRFWLFFEGRETRAELVPPAISPVEREGTTVVEWGGAILP